jgi:hypothetical protein
MSSKTFLFIASVCIVANPFRLAAREPSIIKPSATSPVIVNANDDQRYDVFDRFIVKEGDDEGFIEPLESLLSPFNEAVKTNPRPRLVQELVDSKKVKQRQDATKPKLTVIVRSEPKPDETLDNVDSEDVDSGKVDSGKVDSGKVDSGKVDSGKVDSVDPGKRPAASTHHHHHHHYRNGHHPHRHQIRTQKRRFGRMRNYPVR